MDAPGTRYKVVERGRRLEVIDTWNRDTPITRSRPDPEQQAIQHDASSAAEAIRLSRRGAPSAAEAIRAPRPDQRGRGPIQTQPWYDAKGPRQIVVTDRGAERLKGLRNIALVVLSIAAITAFLFWPLFFILPFFIFSGGARKNFRAASTKFLDNLNRP